jgi:probable HAF family extracellular repeat protein
MRDLGTLFGTGSNPDYSSTASGINGTGQVAGIATAPGGRFHAFITGPDGMGMRDLGDLGGYGYSSANDINVVGQVVGGYFTAGDAVHAFITGPDGMGMRDPGTLGGASSWAYGINDAGQVVGQSLTAGGALHAFITGPDGTGMRDLGEGIATDINAAGQVVGYSGAGGGGLHAFITGSDGAGMMDLNSLVNLPRWMVLEQATAINNAGQVLVIGTIPEPESYAFFLAGLALIGFMARRKKVSARPLAWGSPVG